MAGSDEITTVELIQAQSIIRAAYYEILKEREKVEYWVKRCLAAEDYIIKTPYDYSMDDDKYRAYRIWRDIKNGEAP